MGNLWSAVIDYCPEGVIRTVSNSYIRHREKRKKDAIDIEESHLIDSLHSPKRRKLTCTAHYIFQALYVEGKDSDITVNILDKDWKLHKIYLGQSQYFNSMFSGSWNESKKSYISIKVEDPNITEEALAAVFGSFYQDEIIVEPRVVVGVLAASTMFQLEGLIEQCYEIMLETISPITVVQYYHASCRYGAQKVKSKVIDWFSVNLTDYYYKNPARLKEIDVELMNVILSNPDLCVIQTEMTLYSLLRRWMYNRLNVDMDTSDCSKEPEPFFCNGEGDVPFLMSETGREFEPIFRRLRLGHLLLHVKDLLNISKDKIIPEAWMLEAYKTQWVNLLRVLSGSDKGPTSVDEEFFNMNSIRCGREIHSGDNRSWRWNWFSFGVDLVWSIVDNSILVRRQRTYLDYTLVDNSHNILVRLDLLTFDEQRQVKKLMKTDIINLSLTRSQETKLLSFDSEFEYPLFIFVKILLTSPAKTVASS
ncbi:protein germ cell-less [Cimex lectularius]|uniref:BTB domain-containing protein n=1 Tax=Cimex lectularius TaxID=79782 RepID=A0A8I6SDE8_CIMLE|nr:protein germ cell-less [Cimex lectularius]